MNPRQLEELKERLLRAGVAPRHVYRFSRELRDHFEDAMRDELAKGSNAAVSAQTAWARLGSAERLEQSVLSRPELRSIVARHPGLVFAAGALLMWLATFALMLFAISTLFDILSTRAGGESRWMLSLLHQSLVFLTYVLPIIFGVLMLIASHRQRLSALWPILGTTLIIILGGTLEAGMTFGPTAKESEVWLHSSLLPFVFRHTDILGRPDVLELSRGLARVLLMLVVALTPYFLWRRRYRPGSA